MCLVVKRRRVWWTHSSVSATIISEYSQLLTMIWSFCQVTITILKQSSWKYLFILMSVASLYLVSLEFAPFGCFPSTNITVFIKVFVDLYIQKFNCYSWVLNELDLLAETNAINHPILKYYLDLSSRTWLSPSLSLISLIASSEFSFLVPHHFSNI